jgi:mannose-1-phosphate guanylyltransferase/phosphomannomutase
MAGGKGTRLRPLTCNVPKPMVPVVNRPMMEHVVDLLLAHGFRDLGCTLCYMPEAIQNHFGDGSALGCKIIYSVEETPLGTAGSVRALGGFLDGTFIVVSGDALTDIDLQAAVEFHKSKGAAATLVLTRVATPLEYGVVIVDDGGRVKRFLEKPSWGEVFSDTVNTGIYVLEPEVISLVDPSREFDFSKNLFPLLLERRYPLFGYVAEGYWCDVGNLEQYRQTHQDILTGRARVRVGGVQVDEGVWREEGSEIEPGVRLIPPVVIGAGAAVRKGALIGDCSVLGPECVVAEDASLLKTVVWAGSYIGREAELRGAILGPRTSVKGHARVDEGAVVGAGCSLGERSHVKSGVKIWPDKVVDQGAQVNTSLVWGLHWSRRLFGTLGVAGLSNIEVTPDFAARLGAAHGTCIARQGAVVVSSDPSPASRMIKRAMASGLTSAGRDVLDIGDATTSIARFAIPTLAAAAGVHARVSPYDACATLVEFLDERGINIDRSTERKVENAFLTEDFKRATCDKVGDVSTVAGTAGRYLDALIRTVNADVIRARGFSLVSGFHRAGPAGIVQHLLTTLECSVVHRLDGTDFLEALGELSALVVQNRADIGFLLDPNAERLTLVDERGEALSAEDLLALVCTGILKSGQSRRVAVPVTASASLEGVARRLGGQIVWAQANPRSVMEKAIEAKIHIGGGTLPQFQPVYDGLFALAVILELMAREQTTLSELVRAVPRSYMRKYSVDCAWQAKGRVMRTLIEESENEDVQLIDGIKVYNDRGWTLILPDSEEPVFHVYSEAQSPEIADEIAAVYMDRIAAVAADGTGESTEGLDGAMS